MPSFLLCQPTWLENPQIQTTLIELFDARSASKQKEKMLSKSSPLLVQENVIIGSIWGLRISAKGRLLYCKIQLAGISHFLVLEYLPEHEYEKSLLRASKKNYYDKVLDLLKTSQKYQYLNGQFQPVAVIPQEPITLTEFHGTLIALNTQQREVWEHQQHTQYGPTIFAGEPGSGKTLILLNKIADIALALATDLEKTKRITIIVPHEALCNSLNQAWQNHHALADIQKEENQHTYHYNPVSIETPQAFLENRQAIQNKTAVGKSAFITWCKNQALSNRYSLSPEQLYQALMLTHAISLLPPQNNKKQKLESALQSIAHVFKLETLKIDQVLTTYITHLQATNTYDPALFDYQTLNVQNEYICFDEAQDLPPALLSLFIQAPFMMAINERQNTEQPERLIESLLKFFFDGLTFQTLEGTHRCPQIITEIYNALDIWANQGFLRLAKKSDTSTPIKSHTRTHATAFLTPSSEDNLKKLTALAQSPNTALILLDENYRELAQKIQPACLFDTLNLPTGLEFETVIVLPCLTSDQLRVTATPQLFQQNTQSQYNSLNRLRVAISRTLKNLILVSPKQQGLITCAQQLFADFCLPDLASLAISLDDPDAWMDTAVKLYQAGQIKMAQTIVQKYCQKNWEDFQSQLRPSPPTQKTQMLTPPIAALPTQLSRSIEKPTTPQPLPTQAPAEKNPKWFKFNSDFIQKITLENLDRAMRGLSAERLFEVLFSTTYCQHTRPFILLDDKEFTLLKQRFARDPLFNKLDVNSYKSCLFDLEQCNRLSALEIPDEIRHQLILSFVPPFYYFFFTLDTNHLVTILQKYLDKINQASLNYIASENTIFKNCSLLYFLCSAEKGRNLLQTHPQLLQNISSKSLCALREKTANQLANTSALYWLCSSDDGQTLIKENPKLLQNISPQALYALRSEAGPHTNTSALYCLCTSDKGRVLLRENPHLLQNISPQALCALRSEAAGADTNTSTFYYLCATDKGRDLLKAHPHLLQNISPQALCALRPKAADSKANVSALYFLCASDKGQDLLQAHPHLLQNISPQALCALLPEASGELANTSAFYSLCSTNKGRDLLEAHPHLLQNISPDALCALLPEASGEQLANTSAFYYLCASDKGRDLLKAYPQLLQNISPDALCARRPKAADVEANTSAFYYLCASNKGRDLLKAYPQLLQNISPDALCARRTEAAEVDAYTSALYFLCANDEELEIFLNLLMTSPHLLATVSEERTKLPKQLHIKLDNILTRLKDAAPNHKPLENDRTPLGQLKFLPPPADFASKNQWMTRPSQ